MTADPTGTHAFPDAARVDACRRAPELGPRIVFFSGGSALGALSGILPRYTHNSAHLITPFDSGGSSAQLRNAFQMLSIGDIRNRLVALAGESESPVQRLLSHRFAADADRADLARQLESMAAGEDSMVAALPDAIQRPIRDSLTGILGKLPGDFDLSGASVGNLVLTANYLTHDRSIHAAIEDFRALLEVRGIVCPIAETDAHLAAKLRDGTEVIGQHLLTGKEAPPVPSSIEDLHLVQSSGQPADVAVCERARQQILSADLICYPMGSFFSSVAANLLPAGVGRALRANSCPKIYIPNTGIDPEQLDMPVDRCVDALVHLVRRDAGVETPMREVLDVVILDRKQAHYPDGVDPEKIRSRGIEALCLDLVTEQSAPHLDPRALVEVLISLTR